MEINKVQVDFYNADPAYVKEKLIKNYLTFISQIDVALKSEGLQSSTKFIHQYNKENFGMVSIKETNRQNFTIAELVEVCNKVEDYWGRKYNLSFMP